jgi:hybrid cluster-associated redox disulfide protein
MIVTMKNRLRFSGELATTAMGILPHDSVDAARESLRWRKDGFRKRLYINKIEMELNTKMTLSSLLQQHPMAMRFFIKRKMLCAGCPTQPFHTLEDVARIHGFAVPAFVKSVEDAIRGDDKKGKHRSCVDETGRQERYAVIISSEKEEI